MKRVNGVWIWRSVRCGSLMAAVAGWSICVNEVQAAAPPAGVAPIQVPSGGLAIDGDLMAGSPEAGTGDWVGTTNGIGILGATGAPLDQTRTFHFIDPYGNSGNDLIFSGGLKWTDNPNVWSWSGGKPSSKTEINNVLMHIGTDAQGHVWTAVSADRASTSGDSYIDFEFLQNPLYRTNDGKFISYGPHGGRSTNDLLLSLAFTGGGKVADFLAYRWQAVPGGGFAYVDVTTALPVGRVFVSLNASTIAVPYGAFGQTTYAPNAFAEAAVDLTVLVSNFDPCTSVGFKTIMVKTKASSSTTASIEDFIDPIQFNLRIGPSANGGPDQVRCYEGAVTTFPLAGAVSAGASPIQSVSWSVISGEAIIADTNALATSVQLAGTSATLRLTALQENGCVASDEVVLRVSPLPTATIAGPQVVCPNVLNTYQAPAGMASYLWTVSGNATISGATNARTVSIRSGSSCAQEFSLSLVVTSNNCSGSASATVMVADTIAPTLSVPADRVLECPADTGTNATGVATAQDECGQVVVTFSDATTTGCGATRTIVRTWTATDACGNATSLPQNIVVRDTIKPTLTLPPNITLQCPADGGTNSTGVARAQDACGSVAVSFSDVVSAGCGNTKVISRTWLAMDDCGNATTGVQTITVEDKTPPVLTVPPSVVLECPADDGTNATGVATALDTCGNATVRFSDAITADCGGAKVIARTWTATDDCGNSASAVQTITLRDSVKPTLTLPPNLTLDCPADTSTNATGIALAQDACSAVVVTFRDSVSNNCGGAQIVARAWTATDECGNAVSAVQTITVRDITKPTLVIPPDRILECPADTSTNATGFASAQDACSTSAISFTDSVTEGCGNTRVIRRQWVATDPCGNAATAVQTITVRDTTKPDLTLPPDRILECPADTSTNATGIAFGQDTCGAVAISFLDSVTNGCAGAKTIARTWTATDECGNQRTGVQMLTVRDTTAPSILAPGDVTVECSASTAPAATGTATAQDACSSATIRFTDAVTNLCGGTKTIVRTWTATDACGNATNRLQTITVRDTTPPSLVLPANRVLNCPGDTRTNVTGTAVAQDLCGSVVISYSDVVTNGCGLTRTVFRQWTAIDQCGNSTNGLQTIVVQDVTKPTLTCRSLTVQCTGDVPAPYADLSAFLAGGGTATDACSPTLSFSLVSDSGLVGSCPGRVTRVYRVSDACGNFAECTQTITVDDTVAPVLRCPTNVTVGCLDSLETAYLGSATATDNCDTNVVITHTDRFVPSEYSINFYAADPVKDSAPYLPTYLKLTPAKLPRPESALLTGRAADPLRNAVAYGPTTSQLDALTSLGGEPMMLGQVAPFQAVIEVSGGPGPERGTIEFSAGWSTHTTSNDRFGYDTNYMVYCAFVDTADTGSFDPHQDARVDSFSSVLVNKGTIDEKIQGTFRISGLDTGDRVIVEIWVVLMANRPQQVGGTIAADLVSAQKVLNPPVPITVGAKTISIGSLSKIGPLVEGQEQPPLPPQPTPPIPQGGVVSVIDRTWTATDDCGNNSTCVQRITVFDATAPSLTVPPSLVLDAPADTSTNATGVAVAQDACGLTTVTFADTVTNTCGVARTITRLWTATDEFNNTTSAVQTITVRDATMPSVIAPANISLECPAEGGTNITGTATATDLSGIAGITFTDGVTTNCGAARMIQRTWTVTDVCGNAGTAVQQITITDTTAPTIDTQPDSDRTVVAGEPFVFDVPVFTDNGGAVSVETVGTTTNVISQTETQVTRQWRATDACGNSATAQQTITIITPEPKVAPLIVAPPRCLAGCVGNQVMLGVEAQGSGPMAYQWFMNGRLLPGATGSSLSLTNLAFADAGIYSVSVSNIAGVATSPGAVVNVAPKLVGDRAASGLRLTWPDGFILQSARIVTGPYVDVAGAASPYFDSASARQRFFQLRPSPFQLKVTPLGSGWARFDLAGAPGINVMIQASSDLANWTTISTNTAPASLDQVMVPAGSLFYRVVPLPPAMAPAAAPVPPAVGTQPAGQSAADGGAFQLSVTPVGAGPFTYQWLRNGALVPEAQENTLELANLLFEDAGLYQVIIGGAGGSTTSRVAVVNVLPRLAAARQGSSLSLSWPAPYILQSASVLGGSYVDQSSAVSPYVFNTQAAAQQFFRLRAPLPTLQVTPIGTQNQISFQGTPGLNYILQASTDLTHWTSLTTNTVSGTYLDADGQSYGRVYRVILAQ